MAENENGTEKSEEPTGKRLQKAREEGQVARSKELATMVVLVVSAVSILILGPMVGETLANVFTSSFSQPRELLMNPDSMSRHLIELTQDVIIGLAPFMLIVLIAGIVGHTALGGWNFSSKALTPKLSKLNPITGLKNMVSVKSLVELGKAIAKTLVVAGVAYFVMAMDIPILAGMGAEDLSVSMKHALEVIAWSFLWLSLSLILIAAIDVPFQSFQHRKELRMTKQEVKEEFRDTEGKPEVKSKVRQLQFDMAFKRMLDAVPEADVVITNPTHFAVALRYDSKRDNAPIVVAKGVDHMAMKIREVAKNHRIERIESPPLTRAVYYSTEVGQEVPSQLYLAIAQILAYVFQLRRYRSGYGKRPGRIPDFEIPEELRRDT